jgi:acetyl esterase/lipase
MMWLFNLVLYSAVIGSILAALLWALSAFLLTGEDLSPYDNHQEHDGWQSFPGHEGPSDGHWEAVAAIELMGRQAIGLSRQQRLVFMRKYLDDMGRRKAWNSEFKPVNAGGVSAEWVLADGANSSKRVLYIHGGAFIAGSPLSHRSITSRFSGISGAAVLAIDYRLMPEHSRRAGIEDCRNAYRWILDNGPQGPEPVSQLVIGGDSAGGNLTLSLAGWVRDEGLRPADAVVALSPTVDATFTSPSIAANVKTDVMLGPLFSVILKIPAPIRRWLFVIENRMNPANPLVSPIFGDLAGLPPTLIQVSEAEMLLDDARRYVNKARAHGTHAQVQSWGHMMHVWQIYYPEVREASEAWEEIRKFLQANTGMA